jgi:dolichol kinase
MSEENSPGSGILFVYLVIVLAGGLYFAVAMLAGAGLMTAAIVAAVAAVIGAAYSSMAFSKKIYEVGFLSILG